MKLTISLVDGALGYSAASAQGLACIGHATAGTIQQLYAFGAPRDLYTTFSKGKLPDRGAFYFQNDGPGPWYGMRPTASTAGTIPDYKRAVHAAVAGTLAGGPPTSFPGPFTNPGKNTPRNLEAVFAAGWDGGNLAIVGSLKGVAVTETITASAGATVKGKRVYDTIDLVTKSAVGANAATVTLFTGNKSAEGASTTDSQVTSVSSVPLDDYEVVAEVTRIGDFAAGTPAVKFSFDGGDTFDEEKSIAAGGVYAGYMASHGATLNFTGAAAKIGDRFSFPLTGPKMTTQNLSDALTALAADPRTWRGLHILGSVTGAQMATIESWCAEQRTAGRWFWYAVESRDLNVDETEATWIASVAADFAGTTSTFGQGVRFDGYYETSLSGPRTGIYRRNHAWATVTQKMRLPMSEHPGQPVIAGPMRGLRKPEDGTGGIQHDERVSPGLGGPVGRGCTLQSLLGFPGQWFVGDGGGKRSPGTMATAISDYSLWMNVEVMMAACRILLEAGARELARRLGTKTTGELLKSEADKIDARVSKALVKGLVSTGDAQSARALVSRTELVYSTKKLPFQVFVGPWSYALEIDFSAGFEAKTI